MPVIKEVQVEMNLDINYVNTDNISSEDWDKFTNSLDYLKNNNWGTPTILIVKNNDFRANLIYQADPEICAGNGYKIKNINRLYFTSNKRIKRRKN